MVFMMMLLFDIANMLLNSEWDPGWNLKLFSDSILVYPFIISIKHNEWYQYDNKTTTRKTRREQ